ncbi:MAG: SDR family oxidoreductase [Brucellaceae bacterium]|nr:SDR family oxidoreductase [Brucellaceae bacterium]
MNLSGLKNTDLDGKSVLITGASTGIGAALATAFCRPGLGDRRNSSKDAAENLKEITAAGGR